MVKLAGFGEVVILRTENEGHSEYPSENQTVCAADQPASCYAGDSIFPHGTLAVRTVHLDGEKISPPMDASFNGLVFACQWDQNNPGQPTYAWKTFYREVWKIEHADAEKMAKLLRRVKRISSSAFARSFGEYVAFVAKALKIKRALKELDHSTPLSSSTSMSMFRLKLRKWPASLTRSLRKSAARQ
jgi:hypothetical protein